MQFRIAMNNVSGIKEYVIQLLKKQISYRELLALDHVSFNVYKGEVVGIIGTNGSGKSTLLKIVSGALKPSSGEVQCDRRKVQLLTLGTGVGGGIIINGEIAPSHRGVGGELGHITVNPDEEATCNCGNHGCLE